VTSAKLYYFSGPRLKEKAAKELLKRINVILNVKGLSSKTDT
jgi:hypothetical protein